METAIIKKLDNLTQAFYKQTAKAFSQTRQSPWPGWERALEIIKPHLPSGTITVLDLACGNGRFYTFLSKSIPNSLDYTGIDGNYELLQEINTLTLVGKSTKTTMQRNIISELLANNFLNTIYREEYNLVGCFGLFHHIPSQDLRISLIKDMTASLKNDGIMIISFWQFAEFERLKNKQLDSNNFGISPDQLEPGDYLLGWDTNTEIARYCHSFTSEEIAELAEASQLKILSQFEADGKEGRVNSYLVLQKAAL
jgi:tRNA (uracil-5-)-methyltransferase TRM9